MNLPPRIERRIEELDNPHRDAEVLEALRERGLSQYEIGDELDVSRSTVAKWLRKLGIEEPMDAREAGQRGARARLHHGEGARIRLVHGS